jgi:hypothetical protein
MSDEEKKESTVVTPFAILATLVLFIEAIIWIGGLIRSMMPEIWGR